jgi:hypothetical protein
MLNVLSREVGRKRHKPQSTIATSTSFLAVKKACGHSRHKILITAPDETTARLGDLLQKDPETEKT